MIILMATEGMRTLGQVVLLKNIAPKINENSKLLFTLSST